MTMTKFNYTPERLGTEHYFTFLVEVDKCPECGHFMMEDWTRRRSPFPKYYEVTQKKQMERAGIVFKGAYLACKDDYICEQCTVKGKATFICVICQQERTTDLLAHNISTSCFCSLCYENVPAKAWKEAVDAAESRHRYDYE